MSSLQGRQAIQTPTTRDLPNTALYPFPQKPNLRVGSSLLLWAGLRCLICADENVQEHLREHLNMKFVYKVREYLTSGLWLRHGFTTALPSLYNILSSIFFTSYTRSLSKLRNLSHMQRNEDRRPTQREAINSGVSVTLRKDRSKCNPQDANNGVVNALFQTLLNKQDIPDSVSPALWQEKTFLLMCLKNQIQGFPSFLLAQQNILI